MPSSASRTVPARCIACQRDVQTPAVCDHCHAVQPVDHVDYFQLFGLDRTYDIDPAVIDARYFNLARAVHPDRLRSDADEVAQLSLRTMSTVNRGRVVLLDPALRADYLLELAGGPDAAAYKDVPQEVLTDALFLREEIAEAQDAGDAAALARCTATVRSRFDKAVGRVAELARALPGDEVTRLGLRAALNTVRYYQKMLEQVAPPHESG
jgi:molecular chaperone HscB